MIYSDAAVIILNFYPPQIVKRAVDSVMLQDYAGSKTIYLGFHDRSEEHKAAVKEQFRGLPVEYVDIDRDLVSDTRAKNVILQYALQKGDHKYLFFLDDDDEWHPDYLRKMISRCSKGFVTCGKEILEEETGLRRTVLDDIDYEGMGFSFTLWKGKELPWFVKQLCDKYILREFSAGCPGYTHIEEPLYTIHQHSSSLTYTLSMGRDAESRKNGIPVRRIGVVLPVTKKALMMEQIAQVQGIGGIVSGSETVKGSVPGFEQTRMQGNSGIVPGYESEKGSVPGLEQTRVQGISGFAPGYEAENGSSPGLEQIARVQGICRIDSGFETDLSEYDAVIAEPDFWKNCRLLPEKTRKIAYAETYGQLAAALGTCADAILPAEPLWIRNLPEDMPVIPVGIPCNISPEEIEKAAKAAMERSLPQKQYYIFNREKHCREAAEIASMIPPDWAECANGKEADVWIDLTREKEDACYGIVQSFVSGIPCISGSFSSVHRILFGTSHLTADRMEEIPYILAHFDAAEQRDILIGNLRLYSRCYQHFFWYNFLVRYLEAVRIP